MRRSNDPMAIQGPRDDGPLFGVLLKEQQGRVYTWLAGRTGGATLAEITTAMGMTTSAAYARVMELMEKGIVREDELATPFVSEQERRFSANAYDVKG